MHVFSNGGCFVYHCLSELMHTNSTFASIKLCGVVFDSCPSVPKLHRGIQVYTNVTSNYSFVVKYFLAACLFVWLVVVVIVSQFAEYLPFRFISVRGLWDYMCKDPAVCPHLYIYSVVDSVIPCKDVENMIAVRRSRGVRVLTQRYDDSPHVAHLMTHRESYTTTCLNFLQLCLHSA